MDAEHTGGNERRETRGKKLRGWKENKERPRKTTKYFCFFFPIYLSAMTEEPQCDLERIDIVCAALNL